jgi:hypothetical protein
MPWFVVSRVTAPNVDRSRDTEYRVCTEEDIESLGPEWEWASSACDTEIEARRIADDLFWDSMD